MSANPEALGHITADYITVPRHEPLAERQGAPGNDIERIEGDEAQRHIERLAFWMPLPDQYV